MGTKPKILALLELTYYWRRGRQFTKLKYIANQNVISAMGKIKRGRPIGSARRRLCSDFEQGGSVFLTENEHFSK